jgi:hypothetical protein
MSSRVPLFWLKVPGVSRSAFSMQPINPQAGTLYIERIKEEDNSTAEKNFMCFFDYLAFFLLFFSFLFFSLLLSFLFAQCGGGLSVPVLQPRYMCHFGRVQQIQAIGGGGGSSASASALSEILLAAARNSFSKFLPVAALISKYAGIAAMPNFSFRKASTSTEETTRSTVRSDFVPTIM